MKSLIQIIFILFVICSSCTQEVPVSEIDFANANLNKEIAVDGFICNERERCRITLRKPVPISEIIEIIPINDAEIVLKHNDDTYYFQLDTNGIYYSTDSILELQGTLIQLRLTIMGKIIMLRK